MGLANYLHMKIKLLISKMFLIRFSPIAYPFPLKGNQRSIERKAVLPLGSQRVTKAGKTFLGWTLLVIVSFLFSCKPESERTADKIKETEKKLVNDSTRMLNRELAEEQLKAYAAFTEKFPEDSRSEEFLYKAAELANSMGKTAVALDYYHSFCQKYPQSKKAPYALFLQAFIYENQLKNLDKAKELYNSFLASYPDHELAKDARFSLDNLGKSEEDLIKMFEDKNKEDTLVKR